MSYVIKKSNGLNLTTVDDGTINNSACDLVLVGKNYTGYGQAVNQNLVKLLENFAGPSRPSNPLIGQLWYDTSSRQLKFYDGSNFKSSPTIQISNTPPSVERAGDFLVMDKKLYVFDGEERILVGPIDAIQDVAESVLVQRVSGSDGFDRFVLVYQIKDVDDESQVETVAVLSQETFTLSTETPIPGFSTLRKGITLNGTNASTGVSSSGTLSSFIFWGTSADALKLNGKEANDYVLYTNPTFGTGVTVNNNNGLNIQSEKLRLAIVNNLPQISSTDARISLSVTSGGILYNAINVDASSGLSLLPSLSPGINTNLGSVTFPFNTLHVRSITSTGTVSANAFSGNITGSVNGSVTGANLTATSSLSVPQIIKTGVAGTGNIGQSTNRFGTVFATTINATTNQATYADLAEKYTSDENYAPGTVVKIGGSAEVTLCDRYECETVAGIVTTNPAYLMNKDLENSVAVALKGRVPCKVKGPVKKGDILVSSNLPGHAEVRRYGHRTNPLAVIGKALEDFNGEVGVIEVMV
jgi:hypothetical protein